MDFSYEVVRLWERPADELLNADLGVAPLAVLGRLPEGVPVEDGIAAIGQRLVERIIKEAAGERAKKLLTDALLLTGLRLRRAAAARVFRGVRAMEESDTYLMILEEGQEKQARKMVLRIGSKNLGPASDEIKDRLAAVKDLDRLERMLERAIAAASWQEVLDTP